MKFGNIMVRPGVLLNFFKPKMSKIKAFLVIQNTVSPDFKVFLE
jgi:hypothetical protein